MRPLLIEDEQKIASFIVSGLKRAGIAIDHATNGESGLDMALTMTYDAAIVDLMLPILDGLNLIDRLRESDSNTLVLILRAKRTLDNCIECLQRRGNDYLVKPFAFFESLVRAYASLRRSTGVVTAGATQEEAELFAAFSHLMERVVRETAWNH
jgi:DNA-binding response OmpR family regulator